MSACQSKKGATIKEENRGGGEKGKKEEIATSLDNGNRLSSGERELAQVNSSTHGALKTGRGRGRKKRREKKEGKRGKFTIIHLIV